MPIEDGMRKATENLDEAAGAAPTSKAADADGSKQQHADDCDENTDVEQNEPEAAHDEGDDD